MISWPSTGQRIPTRPSLKKTHKKTKNTFDNGMHLVHYRSNLHDCRDTARLHRYRGLRTWATHGPRDEYGEITRHCACADGGRGLAPCASRVTSFCINVELVFKLVLLKLSHTLKSANEKGIMLINLPGLGVCSGIRWEVF